MQLSKEKCLKGDETYDSERSLSVDSIESNH